MTAFLTGGCLADIAGHFRDAFARYTSTAGARNRSQTRQRWQGCRTEALGTCCYPAANQQRLQDVRFALQVTIYQCLSSNLLLATVRLWRVCFVHCTCLSEPAMLALALLLALGPTVWSSAPKCEVLNSQPSLKAQPFA